jgi:hypothetical protein
MIKHFPEQKKGEKAILILRRHWLVLIKSAILFVLAVGIPFVFYLMANDLWPEIFKDDSVKGIGILFVSSYYLGIWLFFFAHFVDYYLDVWIVTNKRIISTEQRGLFSRVVSEHKLDKIQDVTSEVHGIIPTFFNYGDVHIQTAGASQKSAFQQVRRPHKIRKIILSLAKQEQHFEHIIRGEDKITTKK